MDREAEAQRRHINLSTVVGGDLQAVVKHLQ
jgi:hypothetical protein